MLNLHSTSDIYILYQICTQTLTIHLSKKVLGGLGGLFLKKSPIVLPRHSLYADACACHISAYLPLCERSSS